MVIKGDNMKKGIKGSLAIIALVLTTGYFGMDLKGHEDGTMINRKATDIPSQTALNNTYHDVAQETLSVFSSNDNQNPPPVTLKTMEGGSVTLKSYKGEYVLLITWATWCLECKKELLTFKNIHPTNYKIVLINMTSSESSSSAVNQYINQYGIKLPVLLDPKGDFQKAFHIQVIPTSILVDRLGHVLHRFYGPTKEAEIEKWLPSSGTS